MELKQETGSDVLKSKHVIEMLMVANDFTLFIEKAEEYSREQIITYLQKIFPVIYLKASLLPDIKVSDEEAIEHYITEENWESVFNTIHAKLGQEDIYYYIDLNERTQQDAIRASIAENIADIYQDLKDFILLFQKPIQTFQENAVKECKHLFQNRYGYHLVNCLTAIHYIIYQKESSNDLFNFQEIL
ncbi:MAG: DUF5063 domain-containing protein [Bacteroidia bacterium]|nr:DUF5063 domain-containing protein [Bacteroidia bacterium]